MGQFDTNSEVVTYRSDRSGDTDDSEMLVFSAKCLLLTTGVVLSLDTAADKSNGSGRHFEPQVAMLCPEKGELANKLFHNKFLSSAGKWESDTDIKATCKKDKVEILEYCKKVYPERDITNIVESSHYVKINSWCKLGKKKCRSGTQQWVKPFRCLERVTKEEKTLASAWPEELKLKPLDDDLLDEEDDDYYDEDYEEDDDLYDDEDDDDYYDDEEYYEDEYNDESEKDESSSSTTSTTTTTTTTTTARPTADPYFTHYDPRDEHAAFMQAERRFEERHRAKVSKVMKDWSDLEERYQDMRAEDPTSAEDFKKQMTERFQKTVQALEEESSAEKRQLLAMHQQRVISRINQRKKEAMQCYTNSLNKSPPNTHRVQKCLQKLLRSMHKDRHHTIQHYKHLLETNMEQADREREITIEHLADIDRLVNESLQMLARYPELNTKILPLMEDYLVALRSRDNTPAPLLNMDKEHEE